MSSSSLDLSEMSIVHWIDETDSHRCGYCKNEKCSISNGMWAEKLTCEDYQNLIDRGWRRSGKYLYKPIMDKTCCPQYTIRSNALSFKLSKSQKKVTKKFNRYLVDGILKKDCKMVTEDGDSSLPSPFLPPSTFLPPSFLSKKPEVNINYDMLSRATAMEQSSSSKEDNTLCNHELNDRREQEKVGQRKVEQGKVEQGKVEQGKVKKGEGADPNKPPSLKAKRLRLERKQHKVLSDQKEAQDKCGQKRMEVKQHEKTLEEFLNDIPEECKHKLTMKLVPTSHPGKEWQETKEVEFAVYKKYQTTIHDDKPGSISMSGFQNFLVKSPIEAQPFPGERTLSGERSLGYGSFHQQYWIDDKLIAVGVLDILPKCISSVYFFYDPDYRDLTLGTYGSLREMEFVRQLNTKIPSIRYYYMGFYIHSCPKMRYKCKLTPSELLCPETYSWQPLEKCLPKLDVTKYARLVDDDRAEVENACSDGDLNRLNALSNYKFVKYKSYHRESEEAERFRFIGKLIGRKCLGTTLVVLD